MDKKAISFLGLCFKAGNLKIGEFGAETALKRKEAVLIILAGDASLNTKKKFENSAYFYKTCCVVAGSKEEFGRAFGRAEISVLAVTQKGFADKLKELLK